MDFTCELRMLLWLVAWLIPVVWNAAIGLGLEPGARTLALGLELAGLLAAAMAAGWIYRERNETAAT